MRSHRPACWRGKSTDGTVHVPGMRISAADIEEVAVWVAEAVVEESPEVCARTYVLQATGTVLYNTPTAYSTAEVGGRV